MRKIKQVHQMIYVWTQADFIYLPIVGDFSYLNKLKKYSHLKLKKYVFAPTFQ
jgi:hypothetical protein